MLHWTGMRLRALPTIPDDVPFALLTSLDARRKPWAFATLAELAQRIHRDRQGEELQLKPMTIATRRGKRAVVQISTPERLIGFAWIGGRDHQALALGLIGARFREAA